jgi:hypothetical protein
MKNYIKAIGLIITLAIFVGCQEDDATVGDIIAPSNIQLNAEIIGVDADNPNGDGSGLVKFMFSADNALSYNLQFGDGISQVVNSGVVTHRYTSAGLNTYTAVINAVGTGGVTSNQAVEITVFSSFDDPEAKDLLSGGEGNSKTWYWAAALPAHLGVGPTFQQDPTQYTFPAYYAAQPFEKAGDPQSSCIYEDQLVFSLDANSVLTYQLNNGGMTYFNGAHASAGGGTGADGDECLDFDTSGTSIVSLAPASGGLPEVDTRGTDMIFSDNNFMGYYVGSNTYEILELTDTTLRVRTLDALNPALAWYHIFSTSPPTESFTSIYNTILWEDNFDVDGAPNPVNWTYDLGAGGWGNNELQTYTNNAENVIVDGGFLKITAKAAGSGYTSARLKSENLREFTYGRVEVRAKLPAAIGTWPAIWMLGEDYATNTWPGCGEIDIMEQTGQDKDVVLGTLHYPGVSPGGGNSNSISVPTATTEFHNYTVEWTPDVIKFLVDGSVFHSFANTATTPFNSDFFMILNIAMGGDLGGTVDPAFTQDVMEIDYVKVYQ